MSNDAVAAADAVAAVVLHFTIVVDLLVITLFGRWICLVRVLVANGLFRGRLSLGLGLGFCSSLSM